MNSVLWYGTILHDTPHVQRVEINGRRYKRTLYDGGPRYYVCATVRATGHFNGWRELTGSCAKIRAAIDAAIANGGQA